MTRTLGLPLLLVTLLIGGYLFTQQSRSNGPSAPAVAQAETQAQTEVAAVNFRAVTTALQAWYAANGTYAGAALPLGAGAAVVRADATSYCLQTTDATPIMHEAGPNGTVQPGRC
jgi:ABC-type hemin transport system substrate-binding protein